MKVNSICIVGGGSSGWMMAIALNNHLPNVDVTLVESPNVPTVGVGESTIPYTSFFIRDILGFEEKEWMPYCNASYKAAIRFCDFSQKGKNIYHPFWNDQEADYNGFDWAVKKHLEDTPIEDYYSTNFITYHMSENNKFSRLEGEGFKYAHHLDASKFGEFCQSKFKGTHILANVKHVKLDGSNIVSVTTDQKQKIEADMFIDCTGFKCLLIEKVLDEPFEWIGDTLLNDTAITCRIPYEDRRAELEPFTDCTALGSGWAWNIPLWSRVGSGYVYSSKFQNEDGAKKEFKDYLIKRFGKERTDQVEFNTVHFKTGKYKRGWVGNCLALTLASGFIEPLESTGLALACYQIENFIDTILDREYSAFKRVCYNEKVDEAFHEIHNFILLHYVNSQREDTPYWKYMKNELETPKDFPMYVKNIEKQKHAWFPTKSRECIMLGFNISSEYSRHHITWHDKPITGLTDQSKKEILEELKYLEKRKADKQREVSGMDILEDYLKRRIYI
jgi:tryptophan halogenase